MEGTNNDLKIQANDHKAKKIKGAVIALVLAAICLILSFIVPSSHGHDESIQILMKDAVLHEVNQINFFGLHVNPGIISAFVVTGIIFVLALAIRIFLIPRFKMVPGKLQLVIEQAVGLFRNMAVENSHHSNKFIGTYIFAAGTYIFIGTLFELFGFQAITTEGSSITLAAPLADINGAIAMGFLSYGIILAGGLFVNGPKGVLKTLKDFSLPLSMSFRLFGALLSGLLVSELVYHFVSLRYVLPVIVAILFTVLHALIQAYVLSILTSIFYGEATE